MNSRKSLYDVKSFYNKNAKLKAGYEGMRYLVEAVEPEEGEKMLHVVIWPEPFCFEKTREEKKHDKEFPYNEEGLDNVYGWLCEQYEEHREYWEHYRDNPMEGIKDNGL